MRYLQIPVNDAVRVEVVNRQQNLLRHFSSLPLIVLASRDNLVKQFTASDTTQKSKLTPQTFHTSHNKKPDFLQLHDKVNLGLHLKHFEQANNVLMFHRLEDIDFSLNHALFAFTFGLVDYFNGEFLASDFVSADFDFGEGAAVC